MHSRHSRLGDIRVYKVMHSRLGDIRVYKSEYAPTTFDDGRPRLFQLAPDFSDGATSLVPLSTGVTVKRTQQWCVLVHPSRWDAFWMAVNQPDVFAHPEVQELLGLAKSG